MYKKIILGIVSLIVLGVAYYGILPLFITTRLDEAVPVAQVQPPNTPAAVQTTPSSEANMVPPVEPETEMKKPVESDVAKPQPVTEPVPVVKTAPIVGTAGHPASGSARLITTDTGSVIRYENFKTINGPDLFVYLATDLEATSFVNLGELKATEGNVNYQVPANVDLANYKYVMVWCKQFGVLFNYADLTLVR
jgi:hypothetical protein